MKGGNKVTKVRSTKPIFLAMATLFLISLAACATVQPTHNRLNIIVHADAYSKKDAKETILGIVHGGSPPSQKDQEKRYKIILRMELNIMYQPERYDDGTVILPDEIRFRMYNLLKEQGLMTLSNMIHITDMKVYLIEGISSHNMRPGIQSVRIKTIQK